MGVSILPESTLISILDDCIQQKREGQKRFYKHFYGFGYTICQRYLSSHEDIVEVLNDGFLKVFTEVHRFEKRQDSLEGSLKAWIRRVLVNTSIDRLRKANQKKKLTIDHSHEMTNLSIQSQAISKLSYDELLKSINQLTPSYRAVFNLFVIDGYSHEEIGKMLNISPGTSKSNLAKARINLQKLLSSEIYSKKYEPKAI
jgi:RNA polymerase sigma-70 factor (ECF subfamily)